MENETTTICPLTGKECDRMDDIDNRIIINLKKITEDIVRHFNDMTKESDKPVLLL